MASKTFSEDEFGDFQTPSLLAKKVISRLSADGWHWRRVLEPTCGTGSFIRGLIESENEFDEIIGIELNEKYAQIAREAGSAVFGKIKIQNGNIFSINLKKDLNWATSLPLIVIGNPPWVTNSKIGCIDGCNLPEKTNIKKLNGLDALTGASNFDISEYIILKIIKELRDERPTLALLCKTAVARSVMSFCCNERLPVSDAKIIGIDALDWFGAAVDACLFVVSVGEPQANFDVEVYSSLDDFTPIATVSFHEGKIVSNKQAYSLLSHLEGAFPFAWRQGIKHDSASVVELKQDPSGAYYNKRGEIVEVEEKYVYPLIKSSELNNGNTAEFKNWLIVPQTHLHEDVSSLRSKAPKLWAYLNKHKELFRSRKSIIYKNKPDFTYFGLGDYSFSSFKVAISGLYKEPVFRVLKKQGSKPVLVDDTCYFVPCETLEQAENLARTLNSEIVLDFLKSISFRDSMRPFTKKVLQRVDLYAATKALA